MMLDFVETWVKSISAALGALTLLVPVLGFRRLDASPRGRASGGATRFLRWWVLLAATFLYVLVGVLLWRPLTLSLPSPVRLIVLLLGILLYFPGIALYLWGYKTLGSMFGFSSGFAAQLYAGHRLITAGPYAYIRHPMYLGVILTALGALLIFRTWAMVLFTLTAFGVTIRARREEQVLAEEFGEAWEAYQARVPGWLPRLRRG